MKDRLTDALKASTADYAEIRFEVNDRNHAGFRGRELDSVQSSKVSGGIVRACKNGGWGQVVFDSAEGLRGRVEEACRAAALVGREKTHLAETPAVDAELPAGFKNDFRGVSLDKKIKLVSAYNDIVMGADPAIESSYVVYSDRFRKVWFANTRGSYFMEERPRVIAYIVAVARRNGLVQEAADGISSIDDFDVVLGKEETARAVARRAVDLTKAPQCKGGPQTVILNPEFAGIFVHEAFGHLSEADFLYENDKMRELMHVGRKIGVPELNVVDDGGATGLSGSEAYDDEGTKTGKTYLIKNGVLSGHLHSLETAGKMDARPTGNARAMARGLPPIVRMTNTYIEPGAGSFKEMLKGVDRGVYACDMHAGQTMMEMFTFTAGYGYMIQNGELGPLVRDVVLTGNVFETLNSIDAIGNDFEFSEKAGGCGKGGQMPLPVSFGGPHVRIRNVVIGGK